MWILISFQPPVAQNIYPLHLLYTTNYRLPGDVDRTNLERHMADADFEVTIIENEVTSIYLGFSNIIG